MYDFIHCYIKFPGENTYNLSTRSTMVKNICMVCLKDFSNNSNLTRHVKNIHGDRGEKDFRREAFSIDSPRQGETDEFDDPRQSSGVYGGGGEFSPDIFSDRSGVGAVSHSECDDNDDNNDSGSEFRDRSDDGSPHTSNDFCQLDIWSAINNWYGGKTGKQKLNFILNRLFKLTLLSRAMSRDDS